MRRQRKQIKRNDVLLLSVLFLLIPAWVSASVVEPVVIAMVRPSVSQIKNIETLYEKDIISLERIQLIGVHHEDEVTDYEKAREYVKDNNLTWVEFKTIKGAVGEKDLFRVNAWTPQFRELIDRCRGIIFTGGMDIPPSVYGEGQRLLTEATTPVRTYYELSLMFHLLGGSRETDLTPLLETRPEFPVLAICLGSQTMNVACGGTLYQDIPSEIYRLETVQQVLARPADGIHSSRYLGALNPLVKDLAPAFHRIRIKKGSIFVRRMGMTVGDTPLVLTSHHQAMKKIGQNLEVTATSMDGNIVEALEHRKYKNVLGIQFHPEKDTLYLKSAYYRKNPGDPLNYNLRHMLKANPPAMKFQRAVWSWFSTAVSR